jgi:hypothetical protein
VQDAAGRPTSAGHEKETAAPWRTTLFHEEAAWTTRRALGVDRRQLAFENPIGRNSTAPVRTPQVGWTRSSRGQTSPLPTPATSSASPCSVTPRSSTSTPQTLCWPDHTRCSRRSGAARPRWAPGPGVRSRQSRGITCSAPVPVASGDAPRI